MRIKFKKHKWKIFLYTSTLIFGILMIIVGAFGSYDSSEYRTVGGTFYSYREAHRYSRNHMEYIAIQTEDLRYSEYAISYVSQVAFISKDFEKNINIGDSIILTLDSDDYIVAIESEGKIYLSLDEAIKRKNNNTNLAYGFGIFWLLVSIIGYSTLVEKKWRKRR